MSGKEKKAGWMSLEECLAEALREGREREVAILIQFLPEEKKEKYRKLWKEIKRGKQCKQGDGAR